MSKSFVAIMMGSDSVLPVMQAVADTVCAKDAKPQQDRS